MDGRSLLLIEDDPEDALLVAEMLSDASLDVALAHFTTLQKALSAWPPATMCVLLDLGLPDARGGVTALDALRAEHPDVPVVVLTGRLDDGIGPEALAAGAQDFLVKGQVDAGGLERSVRYAVERGRAAIERRDFVAAEIRAEENVRLQRGLLPSPLIQTTALCTASFYRPGSERALLGGDFYDLVESPTGVHLLIGDVSGHGPDEAALGVALRIAWRTLVLAGHPGPEVVRGVEQVLFAERHDDERFATIAMVSLSPDLTTADVLLCGHPAPFVVRGRQVEEVSGRGHPILTFLGGRAIEPFTLDLGDEWGLMLFTDGLFEGRAAPTERGRLGVDEIGRHLQSLVLADVSRSEIAPSLLAEAERRNGGPLTDDVAVLVVGRTAWWR